MQVYYTQTMRGLVILKTITFRDVAFALAAGFAVWLACAGSAAPSASLCAARAAGLFESAVVAGQERIEARLSKLAARVAPAAAAGATSGGGKGAAAAARACPGRAAIRAKYDAALDEAGNIEKHLPVLFGFASGFENITEIGVSSVHSSWAFARAAADAAVRGERVRYRASDIKRLPQVDELEDALATCPGVDFSFVTADDLVVETWPSNVLFLDTWHTYKQLVRELERWPQTVSHFMLFHDLVLFGERDESTESTKTDKDALFNGLASKKGLMPAITEFLSTAEGRKWRIWEHFANQNGVLVLKRVAPL